MTYVSYIYLTAKSPQYHRQLAKDHRALILIVSAQCMLTAHLHASLELSEMTFLSAALHFDSPREVLVWMPLLCTFVVLSTLIVDG